MKKYKNEQEIFWEGNFGDDYINRNSDFGNEVGSRTALFSKILSRTKNVSNILELGANIGLNIWAIKNLKLKCKFGAVEINKKAFEQLDSIPNVKTFKGSILDFGLKELGKYDMTFTAGVLIHINPNCLQQVYQRLYECSKTYICLIEYFNPTPVEINYRGFLGKLYKRDFAGEMLDKYSNLELLDYGFLYHRDNNFPEDDINWFLLEKR